MQAAVDSTKASQKKEVERIKDSLRKAKEEIDKKIEKLNRSTALLREDGTEKIKEAYPFIMNI